MPINKIRIHSFNFYGSVAEGPGIRAVIFFQGCEMYCPGCHNPSTWPFNTGTFYTINELVALIMQNAPWNKITISGGEPLLQEEGLLDLIKELKSHSFNIALYTGRELQDVPATLLTFLDYIKVGRFIAELRTTVIPYVGSSNQKFIHL